MNKEENNWIVFEITYVKRAGEEAALVILTSAPKTKKIKYGLIGDSKLYTSEELRGKKWYSKKGDILYLFIVNEDTGQRETLSIDILSDWPRDLMEDVLRMKQAIVDISQHMKKIGI